jgi:hypothetical protein
VIEVMMVPIGHINIPVLSSETVKQTLMGGVGAGVGGGTGDGGGGVGVGGDGGPMVVHGAGIA